MDFSLLGTSAHRLPMADLNGASFIVYDSGPPLAMNTSELPLLLVHSVNATASAFEMAPLLARLGNERRIVALDLPGFGASDRPDVRYSPQNMAQAVVAAIDWIGQTPLDIVALSLGCEFAAEAVLQRRTRVRSLAMISPTGMEKRRADERWQDGRTREVRWLRGLLRGTPVGGPVYRVLTTRLSIRWFLARTWGTSRFDPALLDHGLRCAAQSGAAHAPLDFVSGALFTRGVVQRYRALPCPVWVAHGNRGAFTDFGACPERSAAGSELQRSVFEGGAMPHFQQPQAFVDGYRHFVRHAAMVDTAAVNAAAHGRQFDIPQRLQPLQKGSLS